MKVYVLTITYPYESTEILGIFVNEYLANEASVVAEYEDTSDGYNGYNDFNVEEYEVLSELRE